jgi:hypothetical protein
MLDGLSITSLVISTLLGGHWSKTIHSVRARSGGGIHIAGAEFPSRAEAVCDEQDLLSFSMRSMRSGRTGDWVCWKSG